MLILSSHDRKYFLVIGGKYRVKVSCRCQGATEQRQCRLGPITPRMRIKDHQCPPPRSRRRTPSAAPAPAWVCVGGVVRNRDEGHRLRCAREHRRQAALCRSGLPQKALRKRAHLLQRSLPSTAIGPLHIAAHPFSETRLLHEPRSVRVHSQDFAAREVLITAVECSRPECRIEGEEQAGLVHCPFRREL